MGWRDRFKKIMCKREKNVSENVAKENDHENESCPLPKENKTLKNVLSFFSRRTTSKIHRPKFKPKSQKKQNRIKSFWNIKTKTIRDIVASSQTELNKLFRNCGTIVCSVFGIHRKVKIASADNSGPNISRQFVDKQQKHPSLKIIHSNIKSGKNKAHTTVTSLRKQKLKRIPMLLRQTRKTKSCGTSTRIRAFIECPNTEIEQMEMNLHTVSNSESSNSELSNKIKTIPENALQDVLPCCSTSIDNVPPQKEQFKVKIASAKRSGTKCSQQLIDKQLAHQSVKSVCSKNKSGKNKAHAINTPLRKRKQKRTRSSLRQRRKTKSCDTPTSVKALKNCKELSNKNKTIPDVLPCCSTSIDNVQAQKRHINTDKVFKTDTWVKPVSSWVNYDTKKYDGISIDSSFTQIVIAEVHASDTPYDSSIPITEQHINDVCTATTRTIIEVAPINPPAKNNINLKHCHKWYKPEDVEIQVLSSEYIFMINLRKFVSKQYARILRLIEQELH